MKLVLGQDFPASPPRGFFLTKIYHPNVAPNGDICVNTLKRDWSAKVTISHVLQASATPRSRVDVHARRSAANVALDSRPPGPRFCARRAR